MTNCAVTEEQYLLTLSSAHGLPESKPNAFEVQLPSNIVPDMTVHVRNNLAPICLELESVFINGMINVDADCIVIRKILRSEMNSLGNLQESELIIQPGLYTEDTLLTTINLLGQEVFRLDKETTSGLINIVSLIPDNKLETFADILVIMSCVMAAKLGLVLPVFSTFATPPPVSFSLMQDVCPPAAAATVTAAAGDVDAMTNNDEDTPNKLVTRGRLVDLSQEKYNQLSVVSLPQNQYKLRACVRPTPAKSHDNKRILYQGTSPPNLAANLSKLDLLVENEFLQALPTQLFSPNFLPKKGQAHLASLMLSNNQTNFVQPQFLYPASLKKVWIDLKTSRLKLKLLDSCGAPFAIKSEGETQVTIKVTKTTYT